MRKSIGAAPRLLANLPKAMLKTLPKFLLAPNPEIYLSDNFVVFDLETNTKGDNTSPMPCWSSNSIVCGSWCHGLRGEPHNIYGNELEMGELIEALESADFIIAHKGKFDISWLKRAGIDLYKLILYDTMIAEYCIKGNIKSDLSLDALATNYIGKGKAPYINMCMKGNVDPENMPKSKLIERCNCDIIQTREVFLKQLDIICERDLLGHVYTRSVLSPALADIEANGMHIDSERVEEHYRESATNLAASVQKVDEFTGGINPNSPKQVKEFVYEVLKFKPKRRGKGKWSEPIYSTKSDDLLKLKATTKRQKKFVKLKKEYAGHNADVGKNLLFFHGVATDKREDITKGVFYAQFNQTVTVTHRLSSSGIPRTFEHIKDTKDKAVTKSVQFQNFPRKFKPLFCAREDGWSMAEADGAQLEFRVAAFLGQCPVATQEIVDNKDVHRQSASIINECTEDEVTTEQRQNSKPDTFKPLFGGKSGTKGQQRYYQWFREHYEGIGNTQQAWLDEALYTKELKMVHGFTFFFPNTKVTSTGYQIDSTNICNYGIQHFATAEIIPIAITYLWHAMRTMKSFLVNTIHDSAIAELHPKEHKQFQEYSLHAFTTLVYHYLKEVYNVEFNVPLGIGVKIGKYWGEGKEITCVPKAPYVMDAIDYSELITDWVED